MNTNINPFMELPKLKLDRKGNYNFDSVVPDRKFDENDCTDRIKKACLKNYYYGVFTAEEYNSLISNLRLLSKKNTNNLVAGNSTYELYCDIIENLIENAFEKKEDYLEVIENFETKNNFKSINLKKDNFADILLILKEITSKYTSITSGSLKHFLPKFTIDNATYEDQKFIEKIICSLEEDQDTKYHQIITDNLQEEIYDKYQYQIFADLYDEFAKNANFNTAKALRHTVKSICLKEGRQKEDKNYPKIKLESKTKRLERIRRCRETC